MSTTNSNESTAKASGDESEDSISDNDDENALRIVIETPRKRGPSASVQLTESEKLIVKSVENEIEKDLEEKASKTKLNATNVKTIIKHLVTNKDFLAMVRNSESPSENCDNLMVYEPKLTRSKAKELLSQVPVPWPTPKKLTSETSVLLSDELQEDSSDNEYIPGDDESEDETDKGSIVSDNEPQTPQSQPPSSPPSIPTTPKSSNNTSTQTNWTDDGVFRIPPIKSEKAEVEDATIALRTRSKLCLSSTPLEAIEEAFIPPDITTDMYDMDCDDDDWKDFLKKITRPLDEIAKVGEDDPEDHDPEYNILADEGIDKVDKEELRMDKGVKITRKELNDLIAELYEYTDNYEHDENIDDRSLGIETPPLVEISRDDTEEFARENEKIPTVVNIKEEILNDSAVPEDDAVNETIIEQLQDEDPNDKTIQADEDQPQPELDQEEEETQEIYIEKYQIPLLQQQIEQHIQILAQTFILMYQHPELHESSMQPKEFLYNLKFLCEGKKASMFYGRNLLDAIQIVEDWSALVDSDTKEVQEMKEHVNKTLATAIQRRKTGSEFIPQFPTLILKTISNSSVFMYPSLLPKITFKPKEVFTSKHLFLIEPENQLIAMGLEQFIPFAQADKRNQNRFGQVKVAVAACLIQDHMMPHVNYYKLSKYISEHRRSKFLHCPIFYYYKHGRAPETVHYLLNVDKVAPCERDPKELPYQWMQYVQSTKPVNVAPINLITIETVIPETVVINGVPRLLLPKNPLPQSVTPIVLNNTSLNNQTTQRTADKSSENVKLRPPTRRAIVKAVTKWIKCFRRVISVGKYRALLPRVEEIDCADVEFNMLPSMPFLSTPIKTEVSADHADGSEEKESVETNKESDKESEVESTIEAQEKDNPEEINALLIASTTVKPTNKKDISNAEKKRAKMRKEFLASLQIAAPEDPRLEREKNDMFALAFYDKMREVMDLDDYYKVVKILNDHEDGDAVDLYTQINPILSQKYPELAEEFLLFLREQEAEAVGQLIPWVRMNLRSKFLRKMELYFKDQPAQLRKIYKSLTELSQINDVTLEKVKNTLLPMLKGSQMLIDLFSQNFLNEKPPESLMQGPCEVIDVYKEMAKPANDAPVESFVVPDGEDKYGGANCCCTCHNIEDPEYKNRFKHCIPCGTRFMQGKVYIQSGRGLRPATVSFLTSPHVDHNIRLNGKPLPQSQRKKRSDSSPSKQIAKIENAATGEETEDDEKRKRTVKTPRKRKKTEVKEPAKGKQLEDKNGTAKEQKKRIYKSKKSPKSSTSKPVSEVECKEEIIDTEEEKSDSFGDQRAEDTEPEPMDWEEVTIKTEPLLEPKQESESEFCEESSQDNCDNCESDSNSSSQSDSNLEATNWTREEDKVLLETFQQENDKEYAFKLISNRLRNRTVTQIRNRFQTLMTLLMEQLGN